MYRRKAYNEAGGYSQGYLPEDNSLFARMLDHGWRAQLWDAASLEYRQHSRDQVNILKGYETESVYLRGRMHALIAQLSEKDRMLSEILGSRSWKLSQFLQRIRLLFFPHGSWRERSLHLAIRAYRFLRRVTRW